MATKKKTTPVVETVEEVKEIKEIKEKALDAYMQAIDLSDDGLIIVPEIEKKIRKLK